MNVIKRDGAVVPYDRSKIFNAISKAFKSCKLAISADVVNEIVDEVQIWEDINVEDIQDQVEELLMDYDFKVVAKHYILYREQRKAIRESRKKYVEMLKEKYEGQNIKNQNANLDEASFGGKMGEASSFVAKQYALDYCMSKMAKENHLNNEIYIHDLNAYAVGMHNCLTTPIDKLLANGFKTRQTNVRGAGSVSSAFQLLAVIFQLQSLQQFGGVSASHLDWSMVPYVRLSFYKKYNSIADILIGAKPVNLNTRDEIKALPITDEKYKGKHWWNFCKRYKYRKALQAVKRELAQAVEGMYHNLNTLQSRSGNQLPFTSINYGTCTLEEGRLVTKALLIGSIKGVGDQLSPNEDPEFGRTYGTPIFPCSIFQYMKGVNDKEGTPNYDLFLLALKSTARRLYPNYVNVDWSVNKGYDRNDPKTYVSTMGCRTYNGFDINANPGTNPQTKDGRGNLAPVTIILPTLAMEAKKDVDLFMKHLDDKIHEAKDMLIERYQWMCKQDPSSAKFMYENGTMLGYVPEEGIESALKHGTLAIGQIALAETLQILIGKDHTTKEGMELAIKIEKLFNTRCAEFKKQYHLNFGVYYTPAENLCYTAMTKFKAKYGDIENVTYYMKDGKRHDKPYFTNSIHVPVYIEMSPFEKIEIESKLTGYSNAGCITYIELNSSVINNIKALKTCVQFAMDKDIPYFAINVPADRCQECGYQGEIGEVCPHCGSTHIKHLRRVTGYLTGDYRTAFNPGKQAEVLDRVKHTMKI